MVKKTPAKRIRPTNVPVATQDPFQSQLQSLLKQQKYRQALEEIHKAQRSQPDLRFKPSEAEIWLLRGKQEFQKDDFRQADASLRRALQLGLNGESHYWLAKSLLAMNRLDGAIALIQAAFENGSLPKDYSICYAKLLLLKGDTATVEQLLSQQSKRFPAAQQQWLRGVLALKAQQPEVALTEFQKLKRPVTPGDRPDIWQIYTRQALHQWDTAASQLGLGVQPNNSIWGFSLTRPAYTEHPILQRLALLQQLETGQPPVEQLQISVNNGMSEEVLGILSMLELIQDNNPHDATHALLQLNRRSSKFPQLASLRPALLTLAGQQALMQGEIGCAAEFWQQLQREQDFNPQLAVNLIKVLDMNEDYQELQRLLTRLIKWLEQDFKQHPQNWSPEKSKAALVYGHCRLADTWMAMGRARTGMGELRIAERLDSTSPEVIGRHGLLAALEERYDEATRLLTQALEGGCRSREVYTVLIDTWKELGNSEAAAETRRRFGKNFGDLNPETNTELLPWVEALSTLHYPLFCRLVKEGSEHDPALRACQIFVDAAGELTPGGKICLKQQQVVQLWNQLLQGLSAKEQVPTLQAIALSVLLFAKREKGIVALITQYMGKLMELSDQQPDAKTAYLVILAVKERDPKKLRDPLQAYLSAQPQPGNALAQIQLQVCLYTQSTVQNPLLRSFLESALQREPQNPLLLLAMATTYPVNSPTYEQFKQQGFDLARRLQDAKALQAFRQEEALLNNRMTQEFLPDIGSLDNFNLEDMDDLLESMIRKMLGGKIPPNELKRMLPQLKQMMMNDMPPNFSFGEEEEEDFGFGFPFGELPPPPSRRSPKGRGRR